MGKSRERKKDRQNQTERLTARVPCSDDPSWWPSFEDGALEAVFFLFRDGATKGGYCKAYVTGADDHYLELERDFTAETEGIVREGVFDVYSKIAEEESVGEEMLREKYGLVQGI